MSARHNLTSCAAWRNVDPQGGAVSPEQAMRAQLDTMLRCLAGTPSPDELAWMSEAIRQGLPEAARSFVLREPPATQAGAERLRRNVYIVRAFRELGGSPAEFKKKWDRYASGTHRNWRDEELPPASATPLEVALFHATKLCRSQTLGLTQIDEVLSGKLAGNRSDFDQP